MSHLLDLIGAWMEREPAATAYLVVCFIVALQTYLIFGR